MQNTGNRSGGWRYGVAISLDGFIAGPNDEADWIVMDPEVDFEEFNIQFDTILMGRHRKTAALTSAIRSRGVRQGGRHSSGRCRVAR